MKRKQKDLKKKIRSLKIDYYVWIFDIVFVVGFMSYGVIVSMVNHGSGLLFAVILASGLSYVVGMILHNSTATEMWKKITQLNKQEEK